MISQRYTALASDKAHAHRYLEGRESHVWRHYAATGDDEFSKRIKTSKNVRTRCVIQRAALHDAPCRSFPDLAHIQWINRYYHCRSEARRGRGAARGRAGRD